MKTAAAVGTMNKARLLRVEIVLAHRRSRRMPGYRGEDVVLEFLKDPVWVPEVRMVFGGWGMTEKVRGYQPGRGD
jgi:hypothetical protein